MIRKAVLPVAGLGTRMLPATKAVPKEMLCLINKPVIQYIVEEAVASGIRDLIFVVSRGKEAILDHFDFSPELEAELEERGKKALLDEVRRVSGLVENLSAVRQKKALGLGHAILVAAPLVGDEPFAVLLGDDIVEAEEPCLRQLIRAAEELRAPVIGVERLPREEVHRYGVIDGEPLREGLYRINDVVEKPRPEEAPSELAIIGRYVFFPEIFTYLEKIPPGAGGEIQLTDALAAMIRDGKEVYALELKGVRYDTGNPEGFVKATVALALKDPELGPKIRKFLSDLL
ncbi:UTP--glucose-1-phosphate uridylyltransferase GalU [Thermosulfurimonas sp. F29]|uniref:UTP--glucose-1-phosphate uridylyltransferase GalU n=1 Tax=Thermosulfurimonas sp. F29 TaxID=2867247 RepID=UPI001C832279|nr:UTP--glucose-1-phosphate uridylyltransferase GalU [Thermosulfurimonas sp. F29]MBX6423510.1 UTP--glucose-1-phosphate uridylyltransferase GalU [Thermosulfurimonas sp. F29]